MNEFTRQYLETALWSSLAGDDEPLDTATPDREAYNLSDIAPEAVVQAEADCARFQKENEANLEAFYADHDESTAGHCFWLDRNGHGTGFWDRSPEPAVTALSEAAQAFGEVYLHEIGGKIHV